MEREISAISYHTRVLVWAHWYYGKVRFVYTNDTL